MDSQFVIFKVNVIAQILGEEQDITKTVRFSGKTTVLQAIEKVKELIRIPPGDTTEYGLYKSNSTSPLDVTSPLGSLQIKDWDVLKMRDVNDIPITSARDSKKKAPRVPSKLSFLRTLSAKPIGTSKDSTSPRDNQTSKSGLRAPDKSQSNSTGRQNYQRTYSSPMTLEQAAQTGGQNSQSKPKLSNMKNNVSTEDIDALLDHLSSPSSDPVTYEDISKLGSPPDIPLPEIPQSYVPKYRRKPLKKSKSNKYLVDSKSSNPPSSARRFDTQTNHNSTNHKKNTTSSVTGDPDRVILKIINPGPSQPFTKLLKVDLKSTLYDVVKIVTTKFDLRDIEDYGFFKADKDGKAATGKVLPQTVPLRTFAGKAMNLIFQKIQQRLKIMILGNGVEVKITEDVHTKIKDVIEKVLKSQNPNTDEKRIPFYKLTLNRVDYSKNTHNSERSSPPQREIGELTLNHKSTLQIYDIYSEDTLNLLFDENSYKGELEEIKLKKETGVRNKFRTQFHTFKKPNSKNATNNEEDGMQVNNNGFKNPDLPGTPVFGVDISKIPTVEFKQMKIPVILKVLREEFYNLDGLKTEGVFRKAGDEKHLDIYKQQLNHGTFDKCNDVHVICTLIKRWFGESPQRLYSHISQEHFRQCLTDITMCEKLSDYFEEPGKTLLLWLTELLVEIAMNESENKMTSANLAVVLGPVVALIPIGNPIAGLVVTGETVTTLERFMQGMMRAKREALLERSGSLKDENGEVCIDALMDEILGADVTDEEL